MVRAAAAGVIDFRQADPFDNWWQRRLHWVLEELDNQDFRRLLEVQHRHWVALMAAGVTEDSWDKAYGHARQSLAKITELTFPWHKDQLANQIQSEREAAIGAWRKEWGYPGEPKYDAMVENLNKAFEELHKSSTLRPELG